MINENILTLSTLITFMVAEHTIYNKEVRNNKEKCIDYFLVCSIRIII